MNFNQAVEDNKEALIASLQEIIRVKSVEGEPEEGKPFGPGPYAALEKFLAIADGMGFETKNMEGYAGYVEFGEGEETVGILAHLDVVPEGDGWTYPPYGAEIHDGKIYGRGTADDKGPAMSCLYGMKIIKDSGLKLNRKIRLILGTNEETNWGCMKYYFAHEKPPTLGFTPDSDFPVIYAEKGIIIFELIKDVTDGSVIELVGGNAPNMVPDSAKAVIKADIEKLNKALEGFERKENISIAEENGAIKVEAKGISAHGSAPERGLNAITILFDFLAHSKSATGEFAKFIEFYNEKIGYKVNGENIGCGFYEEMSGKLNFNVGVISIKEGKIVLTINIRYPISSSDTEVYEGIEKAIENTGVTLVKGGHKQEPLYVPKDNFLVKKLMEVYREETGDLKSEPITTGGGTYARATENVVAFGMAFPGDIDVMHQKDEFVLLDNLILATKIYTKAMYELAK